MASPPPLLQTYSLVASTWIALAVTTMDNEFAEDAIGEAQASLQGLLWLENALYETPPGANFVSDINTSPELVHHTFCVFVCVCVQWPGVIVESLRCLPCSSPRWWHVWFPQRELFQTNGCYQAQDPGCDHVLNGLFSNGLHAVVQYYVATARDVLTARATANMTAMTLQVSPEWHMGLSYRNLNVLA